MTARRLPDSGLQSPHTASTASLLQRALVGTGRSLPCTPQRPLCPGRGPRTLFMQPKPRRSMAPRLR